jgi:hypothetical protein
MMPAPPWSSGPPDPAGPIHPAGARVQLSRVPTPYPRLEDHRLPKARDH